METEELEEEKLLSPDDPRLKLHFLKRVTREKGGELTTIKLWECGICGHDFKQQYSLIRHLATHSKERNFICEYCHKCFRQMSTLKQHESSHSLDKPYICQHCQKSFSRVSTLTSHLKTHGEEKKHVCHICHKGFHQKINLINHLHVHNNTRPFKCDICDKGFNQKSNLVYHQNHYHSSNASGTNKVIIINSINTQQYKETTEKGHTPYALFKPSKNQIPYLVKIVPGSEQKHLLFPATSDDLKAFYLDSGQVQVPIVATVVQNENEDGTVSLNVLPPTYDVKIESNKNNETSNTSAKEDEIQYVRKLEDGSYELLNDAQAKNIKKSSNVHKEEESNIKISNLMSALNESGYQFNGDEQQIIISENGEHFIVGPV